MTEHQSQSAHLDLEALALASGARTVTDRPDIELSFTAEALQAFVDAVRCAAG